ncbi:MAG: bacillithiol biosynthesis cysteine-adding enzyme BshC [Acidobacteriota bacterium]|nr:bacillithiol biosynthesis cysteine-adding enzyme BshC [Acidobacteriota bacterium]
MDCTCIRQTELPGATRLFADLVYHPDRTSPFFLPPRPHFDFPDSRRSALVSALLAQNGPSPLLNRLAEPGTVAVVTGQQVGLYSGPAYTVYKALTAVKLARQLTESGTPAVPLFWLATEDHDFAEINHAWVFDSNFTPTKLNASTVPPPDQPVGLIPVDSLDFAALRTALAGLPFAEEVIALTESAYGSGSTFGRSFGTLLRCLLGSHEVLQIDPLAPAVRQLAAPILSEAVDAAPELTRALLTRNRELAQAGYHAQVHIEEQTALFFLLENGKRPALRRQNGDYVHHGRHFSPEELKARAAELSPNALLRPVIQDFMIPTHTYVGGPAELSYLAQSSVLYDRLLGRQPHALHRSGFTVIDHHSHKLMSRYHLDLPAFFAGEDSLRRRMAETLVPPALTARMSNARVTTTVALSRLNTDFLRFDPTLAKALDRSTRKIKYQLSKTEAKLARQIFLRNERAAADALSLSNLIFPQRHLQERFYSILPLVAQHGLALVGDIYEHLQLSCPDHQLVTI